MSEIKVNSVVNSTGDNDSGLDLSTNDVVAVKTADTTAVTVDSSQHVGIGTTSPDGTLHVHSASAGSVTANTEADELIVENNGNGGISILTPDTARSALFLGHASDNLKVQLRHDGNTSLGSLISDSTFTFNVGGGNERMRIDNEGNLLVGGTSDTGFQIVSTATGQHGCLDCISSSTNGYYALRIDMHANNNYAQLFRQGGSVVGTILISSGSTQYNTSSDYRLKENVTYDFDATTRLKQLRPCRFNFTAYADTTVDGFLAHEVSSIVPEAVSGEKDAVDADGNIDPQGIDQSKLVPLLVKTIQELEARITALENAE